MKLELTHARLVEKLIYEPETGIFRWRHDSRGAKAGDIAGAVGKAGYRQFTIDGRQYKAHRLAWLYVHGSWPVNDIDHRDHNRDNNAIRNLRDVTDAINNQNIVRPQKRNKAQLLGVYPQRKRWCARIAFGDKRIFLGVHDTPEQAHQAYLAAKREHHPGNTL